MPNKMVELERLLERQLKKAGFSINELPSDMEKWTSFLLSIHSSYNQASQDRYLMERSLALASREMAELNEKIENAQFLSGFGYWSYDRVSGKVNWSKKIYDMIGFDFSNHVPNYDNIMRDYVHSDDSMRIQNKIDNAFLNGEDYEDEIRIINLIDKSYRWYFVKGHVDGCKNSSGQYDILTGIIIDITKSKESEIKISELNKKLISAARRAGMTEVAVSVLHNIGNVLNSVNVSSGLILDKVETLKINHMEKAVNMINDNRENLSNYLTSDQKGKLIPKFLCEVIKDLKADIGLITVEIDNIRKYSSHMREIINKQQQITSTEAVKEEFTVDEIITDAIQISIGAAQMVPVKVINDSDKNIRFVADKHNILQVLINLIKNAVESHILAANTKDRIQITVEYNKADVAFIIRDYGVGISPESLKNLFTFGFTTKKEGHGYGLHNCSLIVKELGGTLTVESKGVDQGAEFRLHIPIKNKEVTLNE